MERISNKNKTRTSGDRPNLCPVKERYRMIKRVRVRIHTRKRQNIFFVAHRQKKHRIFGAFFLYLRCFTAFLLAFSILIKLRCAVFSVRRFFIFTLFFVHFVPHSPRNPFGTSSKKHQSQVKFVSDCFFFFI